MNTKRQPRQIRDRIRALRLEIRRLRLLETAAALAEQQRSACAAIAPGVEEADFAAAIQEAQRRGLIYRQDFRGNLEWTVAVFQECSSTPTAAGKGAGKQTVANSAPPASQPLDRSSSPTLWDQKSAGVKNHWLGVVVIGAIAVAGAIVTFFDLIEKTDHFFGANHNMNDVAVSQPEYRSDRK